LPTSPPNPNSIIQTLPTPGGNLQGPISPGNPSQPSPFPGVVIDLNPNFKMPMVGPNNPNIQNGVMRPG
jgi:hypothetical protein